MDLGIEKERKTRGMCVCVCVCACYHFVGKAGQVPLTLRSRGLFHTVFTFMTELGQIRLHCYLIRYIFNKNTIKFHGQ